MPDSEAAPPASLAHNGESERDMIWIKEKPRFCPQYPDIHNESAGKQ